MNAEVHVEGKEGRRPLYGYDVYLLSESITSSEMEEAFRNYMASATRPVKFSAPLAEEEIRTRVGFMLSDGKPIWQRYIIETAQTDFRGRAKFRTTLRPGDYWIYSIVKTHQGWLIWNVKAPVEFYEKTHVTLNEQNVLRN